MMFCLSIGGPGGGGHRLQRLRGGRPGGAGQRAHDIHLPGDAHRSGHAHRVRLRRILSFPSLLPTFHVLLHAVPPFESCPPLLLPIHASQLPSFPFISCIAASLPARLCRLTRPPRPPTSRLPAQFRCRVRQALWHRRLQAPQPARQEHHQPGAAGRQPGSGRHLPHPGQRRRSHRPRGAR